MDVMKRKGLIIQQGKVTELMTQLANLPECKKNPNDPVSLSEVFRTKKYISEVKAALKKGYTFENLAEIFTERCGVAVSARQIKYHFTRAKNRGLNGKSGRKSGRNSGSENHVSSADSGRTGANDDTEVNVTLSDSEAVSPMNVSGFAFENRVTAKTEGDVDFNAFSFDMRPKES
jgi:hypothetical protein